MHLLDQSGLTDAKKFTLKCPHIIIYKIIYKHIIYYDRYFLNGYKLIISDYRGLWVQNYKDKKENIFLVKFLILSIIRYTLILLVLIPLSI